MTVPSSIEKMCPADDVGDVVPYFRAAVGDVLTTAVFGMCYHTQILLDLFRELERNN